MFMIAGAILTSLIGCMRFLIGQRRLHGEKWRSGGWEMTGVMGGGFVVVSVILALMCSQR